MKLHVSSSWLIGYAKQRGQAACVLRDREIGLATSPERKRGRRTGGDADQKEDETLPLLRERERGAVQAQNCVCLVFSCAVLFGQVEL